MKVLQVRSISSGGGRNSINSQMIKIEISVRLNHGAEKAHLQGAENEASMHTR